MLKLTLSLVVCLACLGLEGDAATVAPALAQGDYHGGPGGPSDCPESQIDCIRLVLTCCSCRICVCDSVYLCLLAMQAFISFFFVW